MMKFFYLNSLSVKSTSQFWAKGFIVVAFILASMNVSALTDRSITPLISYFPTGTTSGTIIGEESPGSLVTITNDGVSTMYVGLLKLQGDVSEYRIVANNCGGSLVAGASCTFEVKYTPTQFGSRLAYATVDSTLDGVTEELTAYFSNHEDTQTETQRRLPAVLNVIKIHEGADTTGTLVDTSTTPLTAGQQYTVEWVLLGYGQTYESMVVGFECTPAELADESCTNGASLFSSGNLTPTGTQISTWTYGDETAYYFAFEATFTAPANDANALALRFYTRSDADLAADRSEISLLAPGNLSRVGGTESGYIGSEGRRLYFNLQPAP